MKATIIGWYGTETIGDRAILAGIIKAINQKVDSIFLGSLYPFFSERTIVEDYSFYVKYCSFKGGIMIFNSKRIQELEKNIQNSDLLIIGGGPLMHIKPLYMLDYAVKYAKKKGKKIIVFGCGVGPIFKMEYMKVLFSIFTNSTEVILRDSIGLTYVREIFSYLNVKFDFSKIKIAYDPSVLACINFKEKNKISKKELKFDLVANLRDFPCEYSKSKERTRNAKQNLTKLIKQINFMSKKILLLPNSYFFIGGDDRDYYNNLKFAGLLNDNVCIQNKPLSIEDTLNIIVSSKKCIGMRFHSIVFQTLLNNNNFVFDYSDPIRGKIIGFLRDINFNFDNYVNIQVKQLPQRIKINKNNKVELKKERLNNLIFL